MRDAMAKPMKIGKVGPTTMPPTTVETQPSMGTVGLKPFEAGGDQMGEVPHFANSVGKDTSRSKGMTGDGSSHWSKH